MSSSARSFVRVASCVLSCTLGVAVLARSAPAQVGPGVSATASASVAAGAGPSPAEIEEAKRYFEQGESLRAAKQFQAALEAYLKSRALVPRASNTLNVAVCLFNLERYDEAYEYFEEALTKFPETALPKDARESALKSMAVIESKVGRLEVSANVDGTLVIDGRNRGKLPLVAPVRVSPGKHVVRVIRDGFSPFEATVDVALGQTKPIDAKLEALTSAGRLRVEGGAALEGGTVTIDGAAVGSVPWEGMLAPGPHVCTVVKDDLGAGPELANVIVGQTVTLAVKPKPLGPERRIVVDPPTADLSIDGVAVGKGRYQGRLPIGPHVVEARELGYFSARLPLAVDAASAADFPVTLKVDATHPRWAVATSGNRLGVEVFGGYQVAGSFGNVSANANGWCRATGVCAQRGLATGFRAGATGVYELRGRFAILVSGGYLSLSGTIDRTHHINEPADYTLVDDLVIRGPFAGVGVGYRLPIVASFDLSARVQMIGAFVGARDSVSGTGTTGDGRVLAVSTTNSGSVFRGIMLLAAPELTAELSFGALRLGLGVVVPISLIDGPVLSLGDTTVTDARKDANGFPTSIDKVKGQAFVSGVRAYSRFVTVVPQISLGYWF